MIVALETTHENCIAICKPFQEMKTAQSLLFAGCSGRFESRILLTGVRGTETVERELCSRILRFQAGHVATKADAFASSARNSFSLIAHLVWPNSFQHLFKQIRSYRLFCQIRCRFHLYPKLRFFDAPIPFFTVFILPAEFIARTQLH